MMFARRQKLGLMEGGSTWKVTACAVCLGLIAVAMLAHGAFAQELKPFDLHGVVVDDVSGQALAGAFVSLTGTQWGSLTNEEGRFRLPDQDPGRISLTVEMLGYETLTWDGSVQEGDVPVVRLVPQALVLEGLQVVTDRFRSRRSATPTTVRAFDRGDLATTSQPTVLDFVALRMGLTRESCGFNSYGSGTCLRIRGRTASVTVYVDEAPVLGGIEYLNHIQPHELYMVEVYAQGRHIRAYTNQFMEQAAKTRLQPVALLF